MKPNPHHNFDRNFRLGHHQRACGTAGNVLIYVVVLMLIFGTLGVAMVSLFSTSTASTATSNDTRRARYLSEAGVRYTIGELRAEDFDEDYVADPLHTLTYTVADAGTFEPNVFNLWFESDADIDAPDVANATPRLGEIPPDFRTDPATPLTDVWLINYEYITGTGPDLVTMRDPVYSFDISGTSLAIDIAGDSFLAEAGERVVIGVEPTENRTIAEGGNLYVARDARFFFPPFNGAINIDRVDYAYARLVDDPDNNRVILENVTASQFPNTLPTFPDPTVSRGSGAGTYDGDFVILSPRNYTVMAEGTSAGVTVGNAYALGMNVYDDSLVRPDDRADITAEDFVTNLSQQETDTRFFEPNLTDFTLAIGGGGANQFGSAFYNATRNIGGQRDYCQQGACLFYLGVRVFFLLDFTSQGDGVTFTLLSGPPNNSASSAGGDVDLPELMGYAGDSRTNSAGTTYLATAPENRGLDPPKIAVEFDTRTNNDTLAYCSGANVNLSTRDDPLINNQDAVQYVYWASESLDLSCRSGADNSTYDDNRHGPGFWQFDTAGKVKSSAAVDPGDGTIYIGSNDNKLYAINPDGTLKWDFTTGGDVISSPALASDGTIYVGSNDNNVYAIDRNGNLKWAFPTGDNVRSSPAVASDGTIYIGSDDGNMYALVDGGAGNVSQKPGWPFNAGAGVPFSLGRPAIGSGGTIYFSALNTVYARNPDGSEKWTRVLGASPGADNDYMPSVDTVAGFGFVYTDVPGNAVAALNSTNGNEVWRVSVNADIDSTPVVGPDGTIYLGTDSNNPALFAVTPGALSGSIKWEFPTLGEVDNIPALSPDGSAVYAVSKDGNLYAVDTDSGTEKWNFEIVTDAADSPANVTSSPVVDPNTGFIYVGSDDNSVYALTTFDDEPLNLRDLLLTSADLGAVVVDSAVDWLNGAGSRGPWAVRLEVDRCPSKIIDAAGECVPDADGKFDYELRMWMKQCINADCDNIMTVDEPFPIDDPFFKDTRIDYRLTLPPNLVQSFKLDAAEFNDFFFGFTAAAGAEVQDVTIANFALSFIRLGDPVIDLPEF